jgi:hypothetical protein
MQCRQGSDLLIAESAQAVRFLQFNWLTNTGQLALLRFYLYS